MTLIDFTQIDQQPIRLTLEEAEPGGYMVRDQHGGNYTLCPVPLGFALKFMRRFCELHDAEIDSASVEMVTWRAAQQFSVKVPPDLSNVVAFRPRMLGHTDEASA